MLASDEQDITFWQFPHTQCQLSKNDSNTGGDRIFHESQCGLVNLSCVIVHLTKFVVPKSVDRNQKIPGEHGNHAQIKKCHTETE